MSEEIVAQAQSILPGDKVLIGINANVSPGEIQRMVDELQSHYPGVEFTFMTNAAFALVMPSEQPSTEPVMQINEASMETKDEENTIYHG